MSPRGTAGSLWLDGLDAAEHRPLAGDIDCEIAIAGGGIAGVLVAERLTRRGADVVLLESERIGRGVTGNTTGKISALQQTVYSGIGDRAKAAEYANAALAGVEAIAELVQRYGVECDFERREACVFAMGEREVEALDDELRAASEAGLGVVRERDNGFGLDAWGSIRLADQAQFNAARFTTGVAASLDGARVYEHARVTGLKERAGSVELRTAAGTVRAKRAIVATHFPFADRGLFFARLEPQRSYCLAFETKEEVPDLMGISAGKPSRSLRTAIAPDGERVLVVGGEGHRTGEDNPARRYSTLEGWAREHFPVGEVTHAWSSQDNMTHDHTPMVGRLHPDSDRVLVVTGFNKWGMAMSASAAAELARVVVGEPRKWPNALRAWEVSLGEAMHSAQAGLKFAEHFAIDHLRRRSAPTCTHMGCRLNWNEAEESWDCPCHGSRFSAEGKVIEGPATRDLDLRA